MAMVIERFGVYLVNLDPTIGHEIKKVRPCLVVSPDEMNQTIGTIIIAPLTSKGHSYPTRIVCTFQKKKGQIALDQIRTVDKTRLIKYLGKVSERVKKEVVDTLLEIFAM